MYDVEPASVCYIIPWRYGYTSRLLPSVVTITKTTCVEACIFCAGGGDEQTWHVRLTSVFVLTSVV